MLMGMRNWCWYGTGSQQPSQHQRSRGGHQHFLLLAAHFPGIFSPEIQTLGDVSAVSKERLNKKPGESEMIN
jgi:hypothetical protein